MKKNYQVPELAVLDMYAEGDLMQQGGFIGVSATPSDKAPDTQKRHSNLWENQEEAK